METQTKSELAIRGKLTAVGKAMAQAFVKADNQASETKRKTLLDVAGKYPAEAEVRIILDAYAIELKALSQEDNVIKVRKAEANAVFQAVLKTEVTHDNLEALKAHIGGYASFITLARELKGKVERISSSKERKSTELTEAQSNVVDINIHKASVNQLADIIDTASTQINKIAAPNMASSQAFILINSIAVNALKNPNLDEAYKAIFEGIADDAQHGVETVRKAMLDQAEEQQAQARSKILLERLEDNLATPKQQAVA